MTRCPRSAGRTRSRWSADKRERNGMKLAQFLEDALVGVLFNAPLLVGVVVLT